MTRGEILNKVLKTLTPVLLENIPINVQNTLLNEYQKYLEDNYSSFNDTYSNEKANILIELLVEREFKKMKDLDQNDKKRLIIKDENKEKLFYLSMKAFGFAKNRVDNQVLITKEEYEKLKLELSETFELIKSFNKESLKFELSEASLDLEYAAGNITDIRSLRLAREIDRKSYTTKH